MIRALAEIVFWLGPAVTVYAYLAFPLVLSMATRRRVRQAPSEEDGAEPAVPVSVIIPAYNEERHIGARIENVLASDYPKDLLEILVVSDASSDRTDEIARGFATAGVRLLVQETRRGKTAGLNLAIPQARGEIVVFTDANASYPPDTIRTLVRYFRDPAVGLVSGFTKYTRGPSGEVGEATNAYTSLERTIKAAESLWGCCVGADGAIFGMRRSLYRPLRADDINDFALPLSVIEQGYRCLHAEDAYCSENPGHSLESEFRRQSRITNRTLRALWRRAHLLDPFRFPAFSFFLFSHKVTRFMAPVLLCASAGALAVLAPHGGFYGAAALIATAGALLAVAVRAAWPASVLAAWARPIRLLHVFVTMNLGMLHGWWKFLSGRAEVTWQHERVLTR